MSDIDAPNYNLELVRELHKDLSRAFVWSGTPQGLDYWVRVSRNLQSFISEAEERRTREAEREFSELEGRLRERMPWMEPATATYMIGYVTGVPVLSGSSLEDIEQGIERLQSILGMGGDA